MMIYAQIGKNWYSDDGIEAADFDKALKEIPKDKNILVRINSPGGNVSDGLAIYNMLKARGEKVTTRVDGVAASIASVICMAGKKRIMPKASMMMIHKASTLASGNADQLRDEATKLESFDEMLASVYAEHTGLAKGKIIDMMDAETWMGGEMAMEKGFCDEITEEAAITNQIDFSSTTFRNVPQNVAGKKQEQTGETNTVNKEQKIALLTSWGVSNFDKKTVTDQELDVLIEKGKPVAAIKKPVQNVGFVNILNGWGVPVLDTDDDAALMGKIAAGKPNGAGEIHAEIIALRTERATQRQERIREVVTNLATDGRFPLAQIETWVELAAKAEGATVENNSILKNLSQMPIKNPGLEPLNVEVGESNSIADLDKIVTNLLKPSQHIIMNNRRRPDEQEAKVISSHAKQINGVVNRMKKFDYTNDKAGILVGPLRDAWDRRASEVNNLGNVRNANTMSDGLLRQVILSESMRAFKRRFSSMNYFAHNYGSVALEGNDFVKVPYYPLYTTASKEFNQAAGYQVAANSQTLSKSIYIAGIGDGVPSPGSGRKYQPLQFSAYEIRRQPWLNIAQLIVMSGEQLAIDTRNEIVGYNVNKANFGNAVWTGAAGGFDANIVSQYLMVAANNAFWPEAMRNMVLKTEYYAALASDPYVKAFLNIGSTDTIRQGKIGGLYGFQETDYDSLLPVANFIQGGDGVVTAGTDPYLAGYIAYPSAVLVATAPIMPGPATLRLLASYEQVTDEQTGLSFSYRYGGNTLGDVDNEIIEVCYGSDIGEVAALKRIVSQGT